MPAESSVVLMSLGGNSEFFLAGTKTPGAANVYPVCGGRREEEGRESEGGRGRGRWREAEGGGGRQRRKAEGGRGRGRGEKEGRRRGESNSFQSTSPVVISEIMYHSQFGSEEYIQVTAHVDTNLWAPSNTSETWKITGISFHFPIGTTLTAGSTAYVSFLDFRDFFGVFPEFLLIFQSELL
jgi:hypothetical protein